LRWETQARALDEMRREGQQDVAMAYRLNYGAERRAATMQARSVTQRDVIATQRALSVT
jgi:hypothetical protein